MTGEVIIGLVAFLVSMIAVVTPIVKLNGNIVELNTTLRAFESNYRENNKVLERRITAHGEQLDDLEKTAVNHEVRISNIEKKVDTE